jgi:hypothetical protein
MANGFVLPFPPLRRPSRVGTQLHPRVASWMARKVEISGLRHQGLPVVFLDVEASALELGSYPIEI